MRDTSDLWKEYIANDDWSFIATIETNGVEYDTISAPSITRNVMSSALTFGECNIASLTFSIMTDDEFDSANPITVLGKLSEGDAVLVGAEIGTAIIGESQIAYEVTECSEQLEFGTFYIDQRSTDYVTGLTTFTCYDRMMMLEGTYPTNDYTKFPKSMKDVADEIAEAIGTEIDERTKISDEWVVPYDDEGESTTMKEVMGYIAACHGGNFIMTEDDKIKLIRPTLKDASILGIDVTSEFVVGYSSVDTGVVDAITGSYTSGSLVNVGAITVTADDTEYSYGTTESDTISVGGLVGLGTTGEFVVGNAKSYAGNALAEIEMENPYVTQDIFNALVKQFKGYPYRAYTISSAVYDPAIEAGDYINFTDVPEDDKIKNIFTAQLTLNTAFRADISAPDSEEYSSEYPYESATDLLSDDVTTLSDDVTTLTETVNSINTSNQHFVYVDDTYANGGGAYVTIEDNASTTNAPTDTYTRLTTEGLEIASSGEQTSTFGEEEIHLGLQSENAQIYLCGDTGWIAEWNGSQIALQAPRGAVFAAPDKYYESIDSYAAYEAYIGFICDSEQDDEGRVTSVSDTEIAAEADAFYYNGIKRFVEKTGQTLYRGGGFISSSKKAVYFSIPYVANGYSASIDVDKIKIRQGGDYVVGDSDTYESSGYTVTYAYRMQSYFGVTLTFSSAISDATNNDVCGIDAYVTFSLSY